MLNNCIQIDSSWINRKINFFRKAQKINSQKNWSKRKILTGNGKHTAYETLKYLGHVGAAKEIQIKQNQSSKISMHPRIFKKMQIYGFTLKFRNIFPQPRDSGDNRNRNWNHRGPEISWNLSVHTEEDSGGLSPAGVGVVSWSFLSIICRQIDR